MAGAHTLDKFPEPIVQLACTKCSRKGQYRKTVLIERYGVDIGLPALLFSIANCDAAKMYQGCGAYYVALDRG